MAPPPSVIGEVWVEQLQRHWASQGWSETRIEAAVLHLAGTPQGRASYMALVQLLDQAGPGQWEALLAELQHAGWAPDQSLDEAQVRSAWRAVLGDDAEAEEQVAAWVHAVSLHDQALATVDLSAYDALLQPGESWGQLAQAESAAPAAAAAGGEAAAAGAAVGAEAGVAASAGATGAATAGAAASSGAFLAVIGGVGLAAAAGGGGGGALPPPAGDGEPGDTTPPAAPTVALTEDTGVAGDDLITGDGRLSLSGVEDGATVQYSSDGTTWGDAFTPAEGDNTVYVRQVDAAGNVSAASDALNFTLDTTAPAAPKVALTVDTGVAGDDVVTSDGRLSLSGVEDGATVQYSSDGATWGDAFTPAEGDNTVYVRQVDAAGNVSAASDALNFTLDTTAPNTTGVVMSVTRGNVEGTTPTITLNFGEALGAAPDGAAFSVTTQIAGEPTSNPVTDVELTAEGLVKLTLTQAFNAGQVNVTYTQPDSGAVLEDVAGNDVASFFSGVVADGYIRGAQVWLDTTGDGKADTDTGIVSNAQGQFFLPVELAMKGSLVMVGGVNIDTGLPNTVALKAPKVEDFSQPVVINPLTTLVQTVVEQGASLEAASASVATSLGLSGQNLLALDPIAQAESLAEAKASATGDDLAALEVREALSLSAQKAAAQVAAVVSLAASDDVEASAAVMSAIATKVASNADTGVTQSFTEALTSSLSEAVQGGALSLNVSQLSAVAEAADAIESASSLDDITQKQAEQLDRQAPAAPQLAVDAITNDTTPVVTLTLNTTAVDGSAVVKGDQITLMVDGAPVRVLVAGEVESSLSVTAGMIESGQVTLTLATPLKTGSHEVSATVTDRAGNTGEQADTQSVVVDLVPPTVLVRSDSDTLGAGDSATLTFVFSKPVTGFTLDDVESSGELSNLSQPINLDNGSQVYSATFTAPAAVEGALSVSVKAGGYTDAAGNAGKASAALDLSIAAVPVVNWAAAGGDGDVISTLAGENVLRGYGQPDLDVTLTVGDQTFTTTADEFGAWTYAFTAAELAALPQGAESISATQDDGVNDPVTESTAVTIDTLAPTLSSLTANGTVISGEVTGEAGAVSVRLTLTNADDKSVTRVVDVAEAETDGAWAYTLSPSDVRTLGQGELEVSVQLVDARGNRSEPQTQTLSVDTTPPVLLAPVLVADSDTGVTGDGVTNASTAELQFQASGATEFAVYVFDEAAFGDSGYASTSEALAAVKAGTAEANLTNSGVAPVAGQEGVYGFSAGLTEGKQFVVVKATDGAGNVTVRGANLVSDSTAASASVTTTQTEPVNAAQTSVAYTVTFDEAVTGELTKDDFTAVGGAVAEVTRVSPTVYGVTVTPQADYEGDLTLAVKAGVVTDLAGNANLASSASAALAVDTVLPEAPVVTLETDSSSGQLITNDPTLARSGVEEGAKVEYSTDGVTWSETFTAEEGANTVYARQTDAAGNVSDASEALNFTLDTQAPSAPGLSLNEDTGGNGVTSNAAWTVTGQEEGAKLQYSTDEGATWADEAPTPTEGANKIWVRQVDVAGNASVPSDPLTFELDTAAPTQSVTITSAYDDVPQDQPETHASGATTNDNTPTLQGSLSAALAEGEVIAIFDGATPQGVVSDFDGLSWKFETSGLSNSTHQFTARVVDLAGNQGAASDAFELTVNAQVPTVTATILSATDDQGEITGDIASGDFTDDATLVLKGSLSGELAPGETVQVHDGNGWQTATVDGTQWSLTLTDLSEGQHMYKAVVQNEGGNRGAESAPFSFEVDITAPALPAWGEAGDDYFKTATPTIEVSGIEDGAHPVLAKPADNEAGFELLDPSAYQVTPDAASAGSFTIKVLTALPDGDYGVLAMDEAGNVSAPVDSGDFAFVIDTGVPDSPVIDAAEARVTNNASPTYTLTGEPGLTLVLAKAVNGVPQDLPQDSYVVTEAPSQDGPSTYTLTVSTTLDDGDYGVLAVDAAGNQSAVPDGETSTNTFRVDTTAPALAVNATIIYDDKGDGTLDAGDTLTITFAEPVAIDALKLSDTSITSVTPLESLEGLSTQYLVTLADEVSLTNGTVTLDAQAVSDAAGNTNAAALVLSLSEAKPGFDLEATFSDILDGESSRAISPNDVTVIDLTGGSQLMFVEVSYAEDGTDRIGLMSAVLVEPSNSGVPAVYRHDFDVGTFPVRAGIEGSYVFQKLALSDGSGTLSAASEMSNISQADVGAVTVYSLTESELLEQVRDEDAPWNFGEAEATYDKAQLAGDTQADLGQQLFALDAWGPASEISAGLQGNALVAVGYASAGATTYFNWMADDNAPPQSSVSVPGELGDLAVRGGEVFASLDGPSDTQPMAYVHIDLANSVVTQIDGDTFFAIQSSNALPGWVGTASDDDLVAGGMSVDGVVYGFAGDDKLSGTAGDDTVVGGLGADSINLGNGGGDTIRFDRASDTTLDVLDKISGFDVANDRFDISSLLSGYELGEAAPALYFDVTAGEQSLVAEITYIGSDLYGPQAMQISLQATNPITYIDLLDAALGDLTFEANSTYTEIAGITTTTAAKVSAGDNAQAELYFTNPLPSNFDLSSFVERALVVGQGELQVKAGAPASYAPLDGQFFVKYGTAKGDGQDDNIVYISEKFSPLTGTTVSLEYDASPNVGIVDLSALTFRLESASPIGIDVSNFVL